MRRGRAIGPVLMFVAGLIVAVARYLDGRAANVPPPPPPVERPEVNRPEQRPTTAPRPGPIGEPAPTSDGVSSVGDDRRDEQIRRVIDSMDSTGRPPEGVAQGGRRSGPKGVFDNAEGRLPRQARGYYTETDVWPRRSGGRGAERLVFGRDGEVYYTADHYRTFTKVRGPTP